VAGSWATELGVPGSVPVVGGDGMSISAGLAAVGGSTALAYGGLAKQRVRSLPLGREAVKARGDVKHEPVPPARAAPAVGSAVAFPVKRVADSLARASAHRGR
jgi:hypothetical protein